MALYYILYGNVLYYMIYSIGYYYKLHITEYTTLYYIKGF